MGFKESVKPPRRSLAALGLAGLLAACGDTPAESARETAAPAAEAATFTDPPAVERVDTGSGAVRVHGRAPAAGEVRLATPAGAAGSAEVAADGRWTLELPASDRPRIFGLSASDGVRAVQAQGYLFIAPTGEAALLRAGAGARRIGPAAPPRLGALDTDAEGGAVVTGFAPPGQPLGVLVDARPAGETRAEPDGRFTVALGQPLRAGRRRIALEGAGFSDAADLDLRPRAPPEGQVMAVAQEGDALRIDWLTPGGGPQTTYLFDGPDGAP